MKTFFQHYLNPLHVYCRLIDMGVNMKLAKRIAIFYERLITSHFLYH